MSRNSHDAVCRGCGDFFKSTGVVICSECAQLEVTFSKPVQSYIVDKMLHMRVVPEFVSEGSSHRSYRTFLVCQDREPSDSDDLARHIQSCERCGKYSGS